MPKIRVIKMCGSRWDQMEFGLFVNDEIKMNCGYGLPKCPYWAKKYPHWWIFWWTRS